MKVKSIRIQEDLLQKVEEYCKNNGKSFSEVVNDALKVYLKNPQELEKFIINVLEKETTLDKILKQHQKQIATLIAQIKKLKYYKKYLERQVEQLEDKIFYYREVFKLQYNISEYFKQLDIMITYSSDIEKLNELNPQEIKKQLEDIHRRIKYHASIVAEILRKRKRKKVKTFT